MNLRPSARYYQKTQVDSLLPTVELIAEAYTDGAGAIHRYTLVPLRVVRVELGPRVGQVLSVDLYEPRVLSAEQVGPDAK
jgi:hypothetical protein